MSYANEGGILKAVQGLSDMDLRREVALKIMKWHPHHHPECSDFLLSKKGDSSTIGHLSNEGGSVKVPAYERDTVSAAIMEASLPKVFDDEDSNESFPFDYVDKLLEIVGLKPNNTAGLNSGHLWAMIHATPRQRCEAALTMYRIYLADNPEMKENAS